MFTMDLSEFHKKARAFEDAARQMPFLLAVSLTNAVKDAREEEYAEMGRVFDRPRPFTLNSLQVVPARKNDLQAELKPKEFGRLPAWRYLGPHIEGGSRSHKSFEKALQRAGILRPGQFAIPSPTAKLDAHGNLSGGLITQILSAVQANPDEQQNMKWRKRKSRGAKKLRTPYYAVKGVGIFVRRGPRLSEPVLLFTNGVNYKKRFPYYEVAQRTIPRAFERQLGIAWEKYVVRPVKAAA